MATGKTAFARSTAAETLTAIIREEPKPLSAVAPAAPVPLRWIVERCLAKEPQERYGSTRDLARDLASLRDHLSEMSSPVGVGAASAPKRPQTIRVGLLALAVLAAIVGALFLGKSLARSPLPSFQRLTFHRGRVNTARFAPDGRTVIYGARWEGEPVHLYTTRLGNRQSSRLELPDADIAAVSSTGEMAILLSKPDGSPPTLARVSLAGGVPREILERVRGADWSPDGRSLAVVREGPVGQRLEYPVGRVLSESREGVLAAPRVSPKGDRVAFLEGNSITVVDIRGNKRELSSGWSRIPESLAWSPSGDEVWFTANQGGWITTVYAVTLSGKQRTVLRLPAFCVLLDILPGGRVLLNLIHPRNFMLARTLGKSAERDLSWHDGSNVAGLSADGGTVLFVEEAEEIAGSYGVGATYARRTDGSPAVRLGDGYPIGFSPDARWAAVLDLENQSQLTLLPTGAGEPRVLKGEGIAYIQERDASVEWFPDGKHLLVRGRESDRPVRSYSQPLEGGKPVPFGPDASSCHSFSPDGTQVICRDDKGSFLWPVEGSERRPIPGILAEETVSGWSTDGKALLVLETKIPGRKNRLPIKITELDISTGKRRPWIEAGPTELAGVEGWNRLAVNGAGYAYSYTRVQSDLYLVDGLK